MTDLAALYHDSIMARGREPRFFRALAEFDREVREINPLCGDRLTLRLRCDAAGSIAAIGGELRACIICIASADLMAEMAQGMTGAEAEACATGFATALRSGGEGEGEGESAWPPRLAPLQIFAPLHAARSRIRCALLPWQGLVHALKPEAAADAS